MRLTPNLLQRLKIYAYGHLHGKQPTREVCSDGISCILQCEVLFFADFTERLIPATEGVPLVSRISLVNQSGALLAGVDIQQLADHRQMGQ